MHLRFFLLLDVMRQGKLLGVRQLTAANDNGPILMSPKEAAQQTSLSRQLLALMARAGEFPLPVQLGERRTAYVRAEVVDWMAKRIAARAGSAA